MYRSCLLCAPNVFFLVSMHRRGLSVDLGTRGSKCLGNGSKSSEENEGGTSASLRSAVAELSELILVSGGAQGAKDFG